MANNSNFLKKRYLIWLYKITKESLDRIDRKFTQLEIDYKLLEYFKKHSNQKLEKSIDEFGCYIKNKEKDAILSKFEENSKQLKEGYVFLKLKLEAVEKQIVMLLGKKGLIDIISLYEKEMTDRILKEREHK